MRQSEKQGAPVDIASDPGEGESPPDFSGRDRRPSSSTEGTTRPPRSSSGTCSRRSPASRGDTTTGGLLLSEGYAAWDVADYSGAMERLRTAASEFSVSYSTRALSERSESLLGTVRANLGFIGRFQGKLSIEAVVDMLENAKRRIEDQGRYDDGVARLYRCVEMLHQFNLERSHGLSTTGVKWSKVPEEARATFLQKTGFERLPDDLDLMRARTSCATCCRSGTALSSPTASSR